MSIPPLGFIEPKDRTNEQMDAHVASLSKMRAFSLAPVSIPVGTKVMLTDFLKDPRVIADMGMHFPGFRQLTGACFRAGTLIRMADGSEKAIEAVNVDDEVITHLGRHRRVVRTFNRKFTGDMVNLQVAGFAFPIEATADHEIATDDTGEIVWKRADDLVKSDRVLIGWDRSPSTDHVVDTLKYLGDDVIVLDELMKDDAFTKGNEPDVPNVNFSSARSVVRRSGVDWKGRVRIRCTHVDNSIPQFVPVCPSFGRLMGLYLAEGGVDEGRITFTLHRKERDTLGAEILALVRGLFGVEGDLVLSDEKPNTCWVRFSNLNLARVMKGLVPGNIYTKRVPGLFFTTTEDIRLALLLGWMAGDGHVGIKKSKSTNDNGNVRLTGVSVCAELARDMTTMALSCGIRATVTRRKARKQSKVSYAVDLCGKKAVSLFPAVAHRASGHRFSDNDRLQTPHGYTRQVRNTRTTPVEELDVYDFEVEEDHSFIASGIVVHNCVGVSEGEITATLSAVQRCVADNPKQAFIPWWPFAYGRTRFNEGDRGQGEGAVSSVMGQTLEGEGTFARLEAPELPQWDTSDGLALTKNIEMQWSDGASPTVTKYLALGKNHLFGSRVPVYTSQDVATAIVNGYPVANGCAYYVGNGSIQGSGDTAYVHGKYDGRGGHETSWQGLYAHPNDGLLFLYVNHWAASTYATDPAGGPRCSVWVPEAEVTRMLNGGNNGIGRGEAFAVSSVNSLPAQADKILDYTSI